MNLLVIAATEAEIGPFITKIRDGHFPVIKVTTLITGVGTLATAYALTKHLQQHRCDLVIQAGVGGSFDRDIKLGDVVFVTSDRYGDLGAEDHDDRLDIFDMGLVAKDAAPHKAGLLVNPLSAIHEKIVLPHVTGLTVNMVSGNERTIQYRMSRYGCQVESMEGTAFHYVCLLEQVPFAQVRAISNYVIPRDKSQWQMKDAIINLNNWLIGFCS